MSQTVLEDLLVVTVTVVEGCKCAPAVRWFNCRCPDTSGWDYKVLPYNYQSVLEGEEGIDGYPLPAAVADIMGKHPGAQFIYMDTKLYGGNMGMGGKTIHEKAKEILAGRKGGQH